MLRRYIESRERYFHGNDTRRESLPFAWGSDRLGIDPGSNPLDDLRQFASRVLETSDDFFRYESTADYSFDGKILKFPSQTQTLSAENNTVWGRVFEGSSDLGVVVLPQWNCDWDGHVRLCQLLQRSGISAVRLSMPYHHFRKPPHLKRPEYMVSANLGLTLESVRQAVLDSRRAGDWLVARGCRKLAILGTSIGSCIGFLTFAHDPRFSAGVFIHASSYFADVVWNGLSTTHVRHSLDGAIDLPQLREIWAPISPFPFVKRLKNTNRRVQMFAGRYDPTFLPHLSQEFFDEFDRCEVPFESHWLRCGHYTMGRFPFNAIVARHILRFMKRERDRR